MCNICVSACFILVLVVSFHVSACCILVLAVSFYVSACCILVLAVSIYVSACCILIIVARISISAAWHIVSACLIWISAANILILTQNDRVMRKHKDYIPGKKAEFMFWLNNFANKVKKLGGNHGISEKEIKLLLDLAAEFDTTVQEENHMQNQLRAQYAKTRAIKRKSEKLSRNIAQRIKFSMNYTSANGKEFDIIGAETSFDKDSFAPKIKLRKVSGGVEISFRKSQTEGINIYRKKEGEGDWEFIAHDLFSPYVDTKDMDKHVNYEYMAWAVINDEEIGVESATSSILV